MADILLASKSKIRLSLFESAGIPVKSIPSNVDENAVKADLLAGNTSTKDVALELAKLKASQIALNHPNSLVVGCDQVLEFERSLFSKPLSQTDALSQLLTLRNNTHQLHSSAVICIGNDIIWQFTGSVSMSMRNFSQDFAERYIDQNWHDIRHCVGCYQLEKVGSRLFSRVDGDFFHVLGLPLLEIMNFLIERGDIDG